MLVLAALVATYYLPQWTAPLPLQVEEIDLSGPEPFKSKEDCYKAAEQFRPKCTNKNGACPVFEEYCDARGCC